MPTCCASTHRCISTMLRRSARPAAAMSRRRFATTRVGPDGDSIARLAAGAGIAAVDAVLAGTVDNAYCLHRPPGHHAEPDEAIGFCIYSNAAVRRPVGAGRRRTRAHRLRRLGRPSRQRHPGDLLARSARTDDFAASGRRISAPAAVRWRRSAPARRVGTSINIPLPPGSGEGAYLAAFERIVLPALRAFRPDMIFVPSGFDAGGHDPLARMMLTSESFRRMTLALMAAAEELCGGRIIMLHEGGYAPHIVPFMALAVFEALSGRNDRSNRPVPAGPGRQPVAGPATPSGPGHNRRRGVKTGLAALMARCSARTSNKSES